MTKKKVSNKIEEQDLTINEDKIEVGFIHFKFPVTRDEADAVINKQSSPVARKMRSYVNALLKAGCKKFLESDLNKDVKNCKFLEDES